MQKASLLINDDEYKKQKNGTRYRSQKNSVVCTIHTLLVVIAFFETDVVS